LNQSFNKCFKPSKLLQKPLYWIRASTNASNHQGYVRNHSIESKLQQMPQTIKATSETTLLNQSFNKCSSTTSKLLQKAQFIDLYQQIKQNHSRSEDYYSLHALP
jgi:hypothetical protein